MWSCFKSNQCWLLLLTNYHFFRLKSGDDRCCKPSISAIFFGFHETILLKNLVSRELLRILENFHFLISVSEPFDFTFHFSKKSESIFFTSHFSKKSESFKFSLFTSQTSQTHCLVCLVLKHWNVGWNLASLIDALQESCLPISPCSLTWLWD